MEHSKYHRTYHLHFSKGVQSDDKIIQDLSGFEGKIVCVLEKLDGECTSIYKDGYHARSLDSQFNWTRSWIAQMQSILSQDLPDDLILRGENVFAEHSVRYPDNSLEGYFYLFGIHTHKNGKLFSLSYEEILEWAQLLDLPTPKCFYQGVFDLEKIKAIANNLDTNKVEGFVVRTIDGFFVEDSHKYMAKYVRENHVQTDVHWLVNAQQNGKLKDNVKPHYMK